MRYLVMAAMLVLVVVCVGGCLTFEQYQRQASLVKQEREELEKLYEERAAVYRLLEEKTREIRAKIADKSITFDEGESFLNLLNTEMNTTIDKVNDQISDTKHNFKLQRDEMGAEGVGKGEYYGGLAIALVLEFLGLNAYRNRKHPLTKEIT